MEAEKKFWEQFHAAWGSDRDNNGGSYNKKSWNYVQARMEEHFQNQAENLKSSQH